MIPDAGSAARIAAMMNRVLATDPETLQALAALSGRVLALEFINTPFTWYLAPAADGIRITRRQEAPPQVRIRGTVPDLFAYLLASRLQHEGYSGSLEIIGDVALAQRFQGIMQRFEFDWEEQLSRYTGDALARRVGRLARQTVRFVRDSGRTLALDLSEYLRYEQDVLPARADLENYSAQVRELQREVERLRQRVERLLRAGG